MPEAASPSLVSQIKEWTGTNSKVHLAGYADVGYTDAEKSDGTFNVGEFSPIFHYLYDDIAMLESEVEFEVEDDGDTEVGLEYFTIDLFLHDYVTLVAGKFLSPIGQFRQNLHPSWINKLPSAPIGFGDGQAAPTDDIGVQVRGGFGVGHDMRVNYALFVSNGPRVEESGASDEDESVKEDGGESSDEASVKRFLRSGEGEFEEEGAGFSIDSSPLDENSNKVVGGRIGFQPIPNLEVAISGATGDASSDEGDRDYDVWGADATFQYEGFDLRAEYVKTTIGGAEAGEKDEDFEAWYAQAAYKLPILDQKIEPVVRWGGYDSLGLQRRQWAFGVNYLFRPNLIGKVAYELNDVDGGEDINRFMAQLAFGF